MRIINSDEVLMTRAEERTASAINAGDALVTFVIDAIALKSNSKGFKTFAFIYTMINVVDKIRMIIVNLRARNQAIEVMSDEELAEEAKEGSSLKMVISSLGNDLKYQFTGHVDI